jgi:hypothetical protein
MIIIRYGYAKQSHSKKLSLISDKNLKIILYYIVAWNESNEE